MVGEKHLNFASVFFFESKNRMIWCCGYHETYHTHDLSARISHSVRPGHFARTRRPDPKPIRKNLVRIGTDPIKLPYRRMSRTQINLLGKNILDSCMKRNTWVHP
ncbi:hypothetical protein YC2023_027389 [Brassica napus]